MSAFTVFWDQELIQKYNYSGPRYTSYPTALEFHEQFSQQDFEQAIADFPNRPLQLYLHIPFCHKLCYFCACNKIVTRQPDKIDLYLDILEKEIRHRAILFKNRQVNQIHFGGGTPTYLNEQQIARLMSLLHQHFHILPTAEISIEMDPRQVEISMIDHLYHHGFNRLSMGIQDFSKEVQMLVNREQDEKKIFELISRAKSIGFHSVNIDLIYGLPKQSLASFTATLEKVVTLKPDRLSVFNYAHLPTRFAAQRRIKEIDLPTSDEKLAILSQTIAYLTANHYQFIGMDHFALENDELAIAQRQGRLNRNFQGYVTQKEVDLLGLGVSAISIIGNSYAQNQKELKAYSSAVTINGHALWKGVTLSWDDVLRREVIYQLICHFYLDFSEIEEKYQIKFKEYFSEELNLLKPLAADGLLELKTNKIQVTPSGRLLIRNICMYFDHYLRQKMPDRQFSKVI